MASKGWHATALDRAHESVATIKADREATQALAQAHIETNLSAPAPTTGS